uniref:sigma-70 family RNA polymerase sigma factor n=1 Tax=Thaumasiovibrio occultus TaxID=1891184 RepID=UPI000B34FFFF|nr:sigma-70 family RNA polymerase sigma factor [Thaumasiovibrio occultus]
MDTNSNRGTTNWKEVMLRIQQGDKAAFASFFSYYSPRLKHYAFKHIGDEQLALEIVQETMTKVWQKANLFDPAKSSPSTWLYTIARNLCFDLLRKNSGREIVLNSEDVYPLEEMGAHDNADPYAPEQAVLKSRLKQWLEVLPAAQQDVVKAVYLEDMPQQQVAEMLDVPLGTVKSRLRLAVEKLRVTMNVEAL